MHIKRGPIEQGAKDEGVSYNVLKGKLFTQMCARGEVFDKIQGVNCFAEMCARGRSCFLDCAKGRAYPWEMLLDWVGGSFLGRNVNRGTSDRRTH
jgi:hypothetical protein